MSDAIIDNMNSPPNTTPVTTVTTQYPAEMGDAHLEKQLDNLVERVDRGFRDMENDIKDLRNEIRDNVSKETFQSEVKRLDDNRSNDVRYNESQFSSLTKTITDSHKTLKDLIDGMKGFTWKALTFALGVATLIFTAASFAINYFM